MCVLYNDCFSDNHSENVTFGVLNLFEQTWNVFILLTFFQHRWHWLLKSFLLLTQCDRDKIADILQTCTNAFSSVKIIVFRFKFHSSFFLRFQLAISQYSFKVVAWCHTGCKALYDEPMMIQLWWTNDDSVRLLRAPQYENKTVCRRKTTTHNRLWVADASLPWQHVTLLNLFSQVSRDGVKASLCPVTIRIISCTIGGSLPSRDIAGRWPPLKNPNLLIKCWIWL